VCQNVENTLAVGMLRGMFGESIDFQLVARTLHGASLLLDEIWKIYVSAYNLAGNQYYTHNVACE